MSSPTNREGERQVQRPPDGMIHQRIDIVIEEGSISKWAHAMRKQSPGIPKQRSERTNKAFSACSAGDLWTARRGEETCNFLFELFSEEKLPSVQGDMELIWKCFTNGVYLIA